MFSSSASQRAEGGDEKAPETGNRSGLNTLERQDTEDSLEGNKEPTVKRKSLRKTLSGVFSSSDSQWKRRTDNMEQVSSAIDSESTHPADISHTPDLSSDYARIMVRQRSLDATNSSSQAVEKGDDAASRRTQLPKSLAQDDDVSGSAPGNISNVKVEAVTEDVLNSENDESWVDNQGLGVVEDEDVLLPAPEESQIGNCDGSRASSLEGQHVLSSNLEISGESSGRPHEQPRLKTSKVDLQIPIDDTASQKRNDDDSNVHIVMMDVVGDSSDNYGEGAATTASMRPSGRRVSERLDGGSVTNVIPQSAFLATTSQDQMPAKAAAQAPTIATSSPRKSVTLQLPSMRTSSMAPNCTDQFDDESSVHSSPKPATCGMPDEFPCVVRSPPPTPVAVDPPGPYHDYHSTSHTTSVKNCGDVHEYDVMNRPIKSIGTSSSPTNRRSSAQRKLVSSMEKVPDADYNISKMLYLGDAKSGHACERRGSGVSSDQTDQLGGAHNLYYQEDRSRRGLTPPPPPPEEAIYAKKYHIDEADQCGGQILPDVPRGNDVDVQLRYGHDCGPGSKNYSGELLGEKIHEKQREQRLARRRKEATSRCRGDRVSCNAESVLRVFPHMSVPPKAGNSIPTTTPISPTVRVLLDVQKRQYLRLQSGSRK